MFVQGQLLMPDWAIDQCLGLVRDKPPSSTTFKSCRSLAPGLDVLHSRNTPFSLYARNGSIESLPRYGESVMACDAELLEGRPGVGFGGGGDVAALGIQDDRDHRTEPVGFRLHGGDHILQRDPALRSIEFEEGRVGLEGGGVGGGRFYRGAGKSPGRPQRWAQADRTDAGRAPRTASEEQSSTRLCEKRKESFHLEINLPSCFEMNRFDPATWQAPG